MAKFTYRMQNILDIKIKLENQAKIAYATASRQLAEEQEKLREILMRRAGYRENQKNWSTERWISRRSGNASVRSM